MKIPKAFVSYSHDSLEHKAWVLGLATRLRSMGIDAILDQWELQPGDDIAHFMETHLAAADKILMVCTSRYVQKANAGSGGVGYEKMIATADIMRSVTASKVIPVIRQDRTCVVPTFLKTRLFIDFSRSDAYEFAIDELARAIHGAPLLSKPAVGSSPFPAQKPPTRQSDAFNQFMLAVAKTVNASGNRRPYLAVLQASGMSRVYFDVLLLQAEDGGLVEHYSGDDVIYLTDDGKQYLVKNGLIEK